ncbi:MAG: ECF transporter S component [Candidatus Bipolaricaulis sp.]|nr:ECF transporter S component [Candidatus Bipolaricaulis sp.]MDD5219476.1 ECF transporter S component [Candidatus Bipolaricaulis sp.]MDD5647202.1 ECF transporter S component [Candidatus Bipolaricaulis sp.]
MNPAASEMRHRFDVRDIVLMALLSAVGGVLSTYIGYLGNLVNRLFGVPFGAGQLISGLHIVWPLLARALVGRFGAGTLTGLTKGAVELFTGGTHGVVILLVSAVEGLFVDLGLGVTRRRGLLITMIAGALASASNVLVFQAVYFSGVSASFLALMTGAALVSGAVFGGYLAWDIERVLVTSRLVRPTDSIEPNGRRTFGWRHAATLSVVLAFLAGGVYFYLRVYDPFPTPGAANVAGTVSAPYEFVYGEWRAEERTVRTELRGSVTYVPPADYTGVPLSLVLERAAPSERASTVRLIASDGYEARLPLSNLAENADVLLTLEGDKLRLVAPGYDGAYWVEQVVRIVVE